MNDPLTQDQRLWLESELHVRRKRLEGQLTVHQEGASRVEHAAEQLRSDEESTRRHAMDREVDLALSDLDTAELDALHRALTRLREGRYGVCHDCGLAIPFDRLQAEPQAERCVPCETAREARPRR